MQSICNHLMCTTGYFNVLKAPSVLCKSLNGRFQVDSNPTLSAILHFSHSRRWCRRVFCM